MRELFGGLLGLLAPVRCAGCDEAKDTSAVFCTSCNALVELASHQGAVFEYGGPVADAIQRFKYHGQSELAGPLGALMAEEARTWVGRVDTVVPVPLHWRRRRSRGFDQAALLAGPIARALDVPAHVRGLHRVRNTPSQVDLPHVERLRNVRGTFVARRLGGAKTVLLIDDVRTTGATLGAAADALRGAGVSEVRTLVLAARVLPRAP